MRIPPSQLSLSRPSCPLTPLPPDPFPFPHQRLYDYLLAKIPLSHVYVDKKPGFVSQMFVLSVLSGEQWGKEKEGGEGMGLGLSLKPSCSGKSALYLTIILYEQYLAPQEEREGGRLVRNHFTLCNLFRNISHSLSLSLIKS